MLKIVKLFFLILISIMTGIMLSFIFMPDLSLQKSANILMSLYNKTHGSLYWKSLSLNKNFKKYNLEFNNLCYNEENFQYILCAEDTKMIFEIKTLKPLKIKINDLKIGKSFIKFNKINKDEKVNLENLRKILIKKELTKLLSNLIIKKISIHTDVILNNYDYFKIIIKKEKEKKLNISIKNNKNLEIKTKINLFKDTLNFKGIDGEIVLSNKLNNFEYNSNIKFNNKENFNIRNISKLKNSDFSFTTQGSGKYIDKKFKGNQKIINIKKNTFADVDLTNCNYSIELVKNKLIIRNNCEIIFKKLNSKYKKMKGFYNKKNNLKINIGIPLILNKESIFSAKFEIHSNSKNLNYNLNSNDSTYSWKNFNFQDVIWNLKYNKKININEIYNKLKDEKILVITPLDNLKGEVELKINEKFKIKDYKNLKINFKTKAKLTSKNQIFQFNQIGYYHYIKNNKDQIKINTFFEKFKIQAPNFKLLETFKNLYSDKRMLKKNTVNNKINFSIDINFPNSSYVSNQITKEAIGFKGLVKINNNKINFRLKIKEFNIELFNKKATIEKLEIEKNNDNFNSRSKITFFKDKQKINVYIETKNTKRNIIFDGADFKTEEDILAYLLFDKEASNLENNEFNSLNNFNSAANNGAIGLGGFLIFGSTPIRNLKYNQENNTYQAELALNQGKLPNLVFGTGENTTQWGFRYQINEYLMIENIYNNFDGSELNRNNSNTTLLEWFRRF